MGWQLELRKKGWGGHWASAMELGKDQGGSSIERGHEHCGRRPVQTRKSGRPFFYHKDYHDRQ